MPVQREDDLDDESYQIRETYLQYGLAMYHAQGLELTLANVLSAAQLKRGEADSEEAWNKLIDGNLRATMSQLIKQLGSHLGDDRDLMVELRAVLQLRNRFAHRYWVEYAAHAVSFEGREVMLAESLRAQSLFEDMATRLEPVVQQYHAALGLVGEVRVRMLADAKDDLHRLAVESFDTPNCPRDLVPMEVAGTDDRPVWQCPECGLTRLM